MLDRFIERLVAEDPELTARDIADLLWLVQHLSVAPGTATGPAAVEAGPAPVRPPEPAGDDLAGPEPVDRGPAGPARPPAPAEGATALLEPEPELLEPTARSAHNNPEVRLQPLGGSLGDGPDQSLRLPTVPALPDARTLARALRPLRLRRPSRFQRTLDERLTVELSAQARAILPVIRPETDRRLHLTVVFDVGTTMWMWADTMTEFVTLLRRLAAFRGIDVRFVDPGQDGPVRFATTRGGPPDLWRATSLLDPAGETAVLVVTDCLGAAWADGRMSAAFAQLGPRAPLAIVQTLPQRVWDRLERLPIADVEFRSTAPVTPAALLDVRLLDPSPDRPLSGVAIPVFPFDAAGLGAWGRLVGGHADRQRSKAFFADGTTLPPVDAVPPDRPAPGELLTRAARLPPHLRRLITYLAAVPLRRSIIRLIREIVVPGAPPTTLGEIVAEGLIEPQRSAERDDPRDEEFRMDGTLRRNLLGALTRGERNHLARTIFEYFQRMNGSPLDFLAFMSSPDLPVIQDAPALAAANADFLRALGGQYERAVEEWERRLRIARTSVTREAPVVLDPDSPILDASGDDRGIDRGEDVGGDVIEEGVTGQSGEGVRRGPAVWGGIPGRNPNFTGREGLLEQLHDQLAVSVTAVLPSALNGMGGVGKTQLATEYVYRYRNEYDLVWWVPAHEASAIRDSLVALADKLGFSVADRARAIEQVLEALRARQPHERWLLVYDNADDIDIVDPYLPLPTYHVLITSRERLWANLAPMIEVDVFTREESIRMLLSRSQTMTPEEADEIADVLGDLPLALEQAAAWHASSAMTSGEFLQLFREHRQRLLQQPARGGTSLPVAVTWQVSIERLTSLSPASAQLMQLMAFFSPEPISVEMLNRGVGEDVPFPLREALRDPVLRSTTVQDVSRYGLARLDPVNRALVVHRLVQAVIEDDMDEALRRQLRAAVVGILTRATPGFPDRSSTWRRHAELAPHVLHALDHGLLADEREATRKMLLEQIRYKYQQGEYESSRSLAERVSAAWERRLGPPDRWDEQKLLADRYLANALRAVGDADGARALNERTYGLLLSSPLFSPDHPFVSLVGLSVGADLRNLGKFEEARDHDVRNLERIREQFQRQPDRTNSLNLARALNNLAIDYRLLFDFERALELDQEAFRTRQELIDDRLDSLDYEINANIVRDLYGLGQYQEARARLEEYLPGHRATVGVDNPNYLVALRTQAILLRKLGDYVGSRTIAEDSYRKHDARFGASHEHTLSSQMTLANTLRVNGEYEEAVRHGTEALGQYRRHFGLDHPFTLLAAINTAIAVRLSGDPERALELNQDTMTRLRRVGGPEGHPPLLCCANNLANDLHALGRPDEAVEYSKLAADRFYAAYGPHPYALGCRYNYALDLIASGDTAGGTALRDQVAQALSEHSYPEHPELLSVSEGYRFELDLEPPPI
ncbi:FxSxx-COOH system tetratricopeptide repeat protein [Dactylosporangium sp. CS-047395]|uniref:FxSxx-COOH system tetratricopeptide repeat protein n=1 Tax=Dactylosporangium sp. CS-047395 TaxID=3239936 RepID=UPI003D8E819C